MAHRDIILIGASAGGVEALRDLVGGLPADLPASLFTVVHFPTDFLSQLPEILARWSALPAVHAQNGMAIRPGHVYVAPPNFHLLLRPGRMELHYTAKVNRFRPAIDPLFRTAARTYGRLRWLGLRRNRTIHKCCEDYHRSVVPHYATS